MRVCIITGGKAPPKGFAAKIVRQSDMIIAADSGLGTATSYGLQADMAVGDFDSLENPRALEDVAQVFRYDTDKYETDTEIAFRHARELGGVDIGIIGGGGGQVAHFLGILSLFGRSEAPDWWITDSAEFRLIKDELRITGRIGEVISFFPVGCETCTMTSVGLRWPLDGITWSCGDIGVSNEFAAAEVWVRMITGRLLMVRDLEA